MNAIIYARYSCDNQREESIEGQLRECREFAERKGFNLVGTYIDSEIEKRAEALPRRIVTALSLHEVSLIDDRYTPCYAGTSIEMRAEGETEEIELRVTDFGDEERFNPYHDPSNGRFTDGTGGGSGAYLYSKGGKSSYVVASENFKGKEAPTKAIVIENMNEAQLNDEMSKVQNYMNHLENKLEEYSNETAYNKAMSESFPLGVGGSGWTDARRKQATANLNKTIDNAVKYNDTRKEYESAKTKYNNLKAAYDTINGTGKTLAEFKENKIKSEVSKLNNSSDRIWEKAKEKIYGNHTSQTYSSNGYKIVSMGSGEGFAIHTPNGKSYMTSSLTKAKAFVEKLDKRAEPIGHG